MQQEPQLLAQEVEAGEEEEERRRSWKWNREGDEDGRLRESLDCARTDFTGLLATPRQTR